MHRGKRLEQYQPKVRPIAWTHCYLLRPLNVLTRIKPLLFVERKYSFRPHQNWR